MRLCDDDELLLVIGEPNSLEKCVVLAGEVRGRD
jgi:hypothetical protein